MHLTKISIYNDYSNKPKCVVPPIEIINTYLYIFSIHKLPGSIIIYTLMKIFSESCSFKLNLDFNYTFLTKSTFPLFYNYFNSFVLFI